MAVPHSGYVFEGWYENSSLISNSANYTFIADRSRSLQANFIEGNYDFRLNRIISNESFYNEYSSFEYIISSDVYATYNVSVTADKASIFKINGNITSSDQPIQCGNGNLNIQLAPSIKNGETVTFTVKVVALGGSGISKTLTNSLTTKGVRFSVSPITINAHLSRTNATHGGYYLSNNDNRTVTISSDYTDEFYIYSRGNDHIMGLSWNFYWDNEKLATGGNSLFPIDPPKEKWTKTTSGVHTLSTKDEVSFFEYKKGQQTPPNTQKIHILNSAGHKQTIEWTFIFQLK